MELLVVLSLFIATSLVSAAPLQEEEKIIKFIFKMQFQQVNAFGTLEETHPDMASALKPDILKALRIRENFESTQKAIRYCYISLKSLKQDEWDGLKTATLQLAEMLSERFRNDEVKLLEKVYGGNENQLNEDKKLLTEYTKVLLHRVIFKFIFSLLLDAEKKFGTLESIDRSLANKLKSALSKSLSTNFKDAHAALTCATKTNLIFDWQNLVVDTTNLADIILNWFEQKDPRLLSFYEGDHRPDLEKDKQVLIKYKNILVFDLGSN